MDNEKQIQIDELAKMLTDRIVDKTWRPGKLAKEIYDMLIPEGYMIISKEEYKKDKLATVYDLYEMCDHYTSAKGSCKECPLYNYTCDPTLADNIDTINDLTIKWKKEHKEKRDDQ